ILKRTSHIRIVLTDEKPAKAEQEAEKPAGATEKKPKKTKKTAKTAAKK
ncbi:MAG: hypothetical protein JO201_03190, partial [Verrucomicrobia bacterium]|nr:hypothetical protein [Verrucomicrobiota bacterium]